MRGRGGRCLCKGDSRVVKNLVTIGKEAAMSIARGELAGNSSLISSLEDGFAGRG